MWAVDLKDGLPTDVWFILHDAMYWRELWRAHAETHWDFSSNNTPRKQIHEGYLLPSQSEHPSCSETLNQKKPERWESLDFIGRCKNQTLFPYHCYWCPQLLGGPPQTDASGSSQMKPLKLETSHHVKSLALDSWLMRDHLERKRWLAEMKQGDKQG